MTFRTIPDLAGKPKENNSMVLKQEHQKICMVMFCKSCAHGETEIVEPEFHATTVTLTTPYLRWCHCNTHRRMGDAESSLQWAASHELVKGMKGHLNALARLTNVNAGSSKGRESYDDGTPIVVRGQESCPQGEGAALEREPELSYDRESRVGIVEFKIGR